MIKILLSIFLVFSISYARNEIYFLPNDSDKIKDDLVQLIEKSKDRIDIAMYNFSYKKFIKALEKASKKGVMINLYLDKSKFKKSKEIHKLIENSGIKYKILEKKNHLKLAMFDDKTAVFGSSNWTKESFSENYEIIYLTDETKEINKIKEIFKALDKE